MSNFFKNLGDTVAKTAEQVGKQSAELVSAGKNKVEQMQLESKIKNLKQDLGGMLYDAYISGNEPSKDTISAICEQIKETEKQIAALD